MHEKRSCEQDRIHGKCSCEKNTRYTVSILANTILETPSELSVHKLKTATLCKKKKKSQATYKCKVKEACRTSCSHHTPVQSSLNCCKSALFAMFQWVDIYMCVYTQYFGWMARSKLCLFSPQLQTVHSCTAVV